MREEDTRAVSSSDTDLVRSTDAEKAQALRDIPLQLRTREPSERVRAFGEARQKKLLEHKTAPPLTVQEVKSSSAEAE